MSLFAVIREAGPGWLPAKTMREQPGWDEHAAFMNGLVDEGFVVFGGPLAGTESGRVRALLIVDASGETEIRRRFDDDPWAPPKLLATTRVEPWEIVMGPERMATATGLRRP